jgi:hypothetical protein
MAKGRMPEETNPSNPLTGFLVRDVIEEMQHAVNDAGPFLVSMTRAEETLRCAQPEKNGTGRKADTPQKAAMPWDGAAEHNVWLTKWLIRLRTAMRLAALQRGTMNVRPMEGTDAKKAAALRLVMLYYMRGAMGSMIPVHGCRAGAWSDRYGHSVLYASWKRERAVQPRTVTKAELVRLAIQRNLQEAQAVGAVFAYTAVVTFILLKVVDVMIGLRVTEEEEREGLDVALHGELLG